MLIPHVVQTEADKVFVNVLNNQTVAVDDGDVIAWNVTTPDGVRTTQPVTATLSLAVGLADGSIASGAYGLAQTYGYKAVGTVSNDTTSTIVAGCILVPTTGVDYLTYSAASDGKSGFFFAAESYDTSTNAPAAASKQVFIKSM